VLSKLKAVQTLATVRWQPFKVEKFNGSTTNVNFHVSRIPETSK
jgi:hypothetical protein